MKHSSHLEETSMIVSFSFKDEDHSEVQTDYLINYQKEVLNLVFPVLHRPHTHP